MSRLADFLAGRNPFGSSGLDVERGRGQFQSGMTSGDVDPRLRNYFYVEPGDSTRFIMGGPTGSWDDFQRQGFIQLGSNVGGLDEDKLVNDWSKLQYSPEFGVYTQQSNVNSPNSWLDQAMPAIMALAAGGIGASYAGALGAAGSGAGAGEAAGTGAFDIGGSSGFGGSTAIDGGGFSGLGAGGLDPETLAGAGGMGGGSGGAGAGAALETHGLLPNVTSPTLNALGPSATAPSGGFFSSLLNGDIAGAGSGLLQGIVDNPMRALMLANAARGMFGSGGGSAPSGGGGGGAAKGGGGQPLDLAAMQGQYRPNPYNVMQMQNYAPVVPRGMGGF